jgi:signal transduction histidine kinase
MNWRRVEDLGLWAVLSFLVLAESGARGDPYWVRAGCIAVLFAGVFLRRIYPLIALTVVAWAQIVILTVSLGTSYGVQIALVPAITLLSYLAGRRETQVRHFVMVCSWSLLGMLLLALTVGRDERTEAVLSWLIMLLLALLLVVLPWLIGRYRAQQALLVSAGWDRAERIEREQRMAIDQERLRERSRIAQDMHDSVGHELSLIALRAAALELDPALPASQRRQASELREMAAVATDRLGEIIGVLREDAGASVVPRDESVPSLVSRAAASGLDVRLVASGEVELSPMVDRAVHRVVQESLTNASKHAPGASVTVTVTSLEDDVQVRIVDTGAVLRVSSASSGGRGLDGLRERVRLVGGTLTAGPRADGGFEVVATIPRLGGRPEPVMASAAVERATVRRSARRGLIMAVAAPVLIGTIIGVVAMGYYLIAGYSSILRPSVYDSLTIGQSEKEVERLLPAMQMIDPPSEGYHPPAGWTCRYYRPDEPFSINYAYRLCFTNGTLTSKSIVQTGSLPPTPEATG